MAVRQWLRTKASFFEENQRERERRGLKLELSKSIDPKKNQKKKQKKKTGGRAPRLPRPLGSLLAQVAVPLRGARVRHRSVPRSGSTHADPHRRFGGLEAPSETEDAFSLFLRRHHFFAAASGAQRACFTRRERYLAPGGAADAWALFEGRKIPPRGVWRRNGGS